MPIGLPDKRGKYGIFGGRYVPELVIPALEELERAFNEIEDDKKFWDEFGRLCRDYIGRPTPLFEAERLSALLGGARIFLKREDLAHTGAHKINNALGQGLLAKRLGKKRIVAETGAGQHGVAVATVCSLLDIDCVIYMGEVDMKRQSINVYKMKLLGAEVREVSAGTGTLKEAVSEAIRDWITNIKTTYYLLGSSVGPHPYPMIVRRFQSIIGEEVKKQARDKLGRLPDIILACVGGGSNAIGIFYPFIEEDVELIGVEAEGSASLSKGEIGVLHGAKSFILQDEWGQIKNTHSIAPGLDYPGVSPEHSYYKEIGRVKYIAVGDRDALEAVRILCQTEGIIPALEPAHALAYAIRLAPSLPSQRVMVINLSGRGDKDIEIISRELKL